MQCNALFLNRAYTAHSSHPVYSYHLKKLDDTFTKNPFGLPVMHGSDLQWTFWDGYNHNVDHERAEQIQNWIVGFATSGGINGDPDFFSKSLQHGWEAGGLNIEFLKYGTEEKVMVMDGGKLEVGRDGETGREERCEGILKILWKEYGMEFTDESI